MGDAAYERAATADEIAGMQAIVARGDVAGAAGFATSFVRTHRGVDGKPVPSRFAELAELDALVRRDGRSGARRDRASAARRAVGLRDLYELQPRIGRAVHVHRAARHRASGGHKPMVEINREAWAKGAEVWPQVTPPAACASR